MPTAASIQRILIVALDNLGDLVFASALAPPLHAAFPAATIDVWCKAYTSAVAALIPHVTSVVAADPFWAVAPNHTRPAVVPFLRSIACVKRQSYDVAVVSEASWRVAAATAAARVPTRIGLARHRNSHFLTHVLPAEDAHKPVVQEQARLLSTLGIASKSPRYRLDRTRLGDIDAIISQLPPSFVAIHPFASTRDRCVALSEWVETAAELSTRGVSVVWIGAARELDELRGLRPPPVGVYIDRIGDGSLRATAATLSRAMLFVGHDSGPLHIAAAFGVPVIGVYAPGQPDRTFPQGTGPWRMISQPSPRGITASTILREIDAIEMSSAS